MRFYIGSLPRLLSYFNQIDAARRKRNPFRDSLFRPGFHTTGVHAANAVSHAGAVSVVISHCDALVSTAIVCGAEKSRFTAAMRTTGIT